MAYTDGKKVGKSNDAKELIDMLTELRTKSQITIPKDIVARLGLHEGDKLEIVEKDGTLPIMPVAVYPKT